MAEWNENGLEKRKTVFAVRRTSTTSHARLQTFSQRLIGDEKIKYPAFSHLLHLLKIKKRKMDQVNTDKCVIFSH